MSGKPWEVQIMETGYAMIAARSTSWILIMVTLLNVCGCMSHRYVVSEPDRVLGNWEKVEATLPGTGVELLLGNGITIQARYQSSTENAIEVLDESGVERAIARQDIREIRATATDDVANGILIGMGLGAAGGALVRASGGGNEGVWSTFGWSLGLGLLIDALMAHHEVLYRAQ